MTGSSRRPGIGALQVATIFVSMLLTDCLTWMAYPMHGVGLIFYAMTCNAG